MEFLYLVEEANTMNTVNTAISQKKREFMIILKIKRQQANCCYVMFIA